MRIPQEVRCNRAAPSGAATGPSLRGGNNTAGEAARQTRTWAGGAEESIQETNDRLLALINAAPVGICSVDSAGLVQTWNARCERILGWPAADVIGRPLPLATNGEVKEFGGIRALLLAGEPFTDIEFAQPRADGSIVELSVSTAPLRDRSGELSGATAMITDIGERKRAQQQQQKFVALVENTTNFVVMMSADGQLQYINEAGRNLIGLDPVTSVVGAWMVDFYAPDCRATFEKVTRPAALRDGRWHGESQLRHFKTGEIIDVRGSVFVILETGFENPLCLAAVFQNITEENRSAAALRRRDVLLDAIAAAGNRLMVETNLGTALKEAIRLIGEASGADHVYIADVYTPDGGEGRISPHYQWAKSHPSSLDLLAPETLNPRWYNLLSVGKTICGRLDDFAGPERDFLIRRGATAILMVPILIDSELWGLIGFEDSVLDRTWSEAEVIILSTAAGSVGGAIARARSEGLLQISNQELGASLERHAAMTGELARAKSDAEAANSAKSEFLANMSHEIRTPMAAILGYTDLLVEQEQTSDERSNTVQTIRRNARYLLDVINDILDVSKIEAGKMEVEQIECSPCRVVADVASMMRGRAAEKNLRFDIVYDGPIPQAIQTDPTRLRQILINLLGNAIKFTEAGQVSLTVRLLSPPDAGRNRLRPAQSGPAGEGRMQFEVHDTGIGMTGEQMAKLFQPFTQADGSTTRRFGGTGLGLTISKRLAQLLGGTLVARSGAGGGSTFMLEIAAGSLDGVELVENPAGALPEDDATAGPAGKTALSARILLAEDGADNRSLMTHYLSKAGAEIIAVENGKLAFDKAMEATEAGHPFDAILMDMQMPVMDGYEAATLLRGKGYAGPIIALTAHVMQEDRDKCLRHGCTDYLSKPFTRASLIDIVARHVQNSPIEDLLAAASAPVPERLKLRDTPSPDIRVIRSSLVNDEDMLPLIELFVSGVPAMVDEVRSSFAEGRQQELGNVLHRVKGTGGNFGFPPIMEAAARAETIVRSGAPLAAAAGDVDALISILQSVEGYDRTKEHV